MLCYNAGAPPGSYSTSKASLPLAKRGDTAFSGRYYRVCRLATAVMDLIGGVGVPPSPPPPRFVTRRHNTRHKKTRSQPFGCHNIFRKAVFPIWPIVFFVTCHNSLPPPPHPHPLSGAQIRSITGPRPCLQIEDLMQGSDNKCMYIRLRQAKHMSSLPPITLYTLCV